MTTAIIPTTPSPSFRPYTPLTFGPTILAGQLAPSSIDKYTQDFCAYFAYAGTPDMALDSGPWPANAREHIISRRAGWNACSSRAIITSRRAS